MAGRPTKLTPALQESICESIATGLTFTDACRICHIGESTFRTWREVGEQSTEGKEFELLTAVKEAEGSFKKVHLTTIKLASEGKQAGQWQAAAWLLERKYPQEFALRQQIAVSDRLDQFIKAFDEIK